MLSQIKEVQLLRWEWRIKDANDGEGILRNFMMLQGCTEKEVKVMLQKLFIVFLPDLFDSNLFVSSGPFQTISVEHTNFPVQELHGGLPAAVILKFVGEVVGHLWHHSELLNDLVCRLEDIQLSGYILEISQLGGIPGWIRFTCIKTENPGRLEYRQGDVICICFGDKYFQVGENMLITKL